MNEIMTISGIECYEKDGVAYLKLETVARGLGFTQKAASGNEVIRWERVRKYLSELGVPTCGDDGFIPENIFYRLAMKAKNETAERFQAKVADEIIPTIRKTGGYGRNDAAILRLTDQMGKLAEHMGKLTEMVVELYKEKAPQREKWKKVPQQLSITEEEGRTHSASELLRKHETGIGICEFNYRMEEKGYLEKIQLQRVKGKEKGSYYPCMILTEKGLPYGKNREKLRSNLEPQPGYYPETFLVLIQKLYEG